AIREPAAPPSWQCPPPRTPTPAGIDWENPRRPARAILPPEEFDHPYAGRLIHIKNADEVRMRELCSLPKDFRVLGCAVPPSHAMGKPGQCTVATAPDDRARADGETPDQLYRHERAHCNGWVHPSDPKSDQAW